MNIEVETRDSEGNIVFKGTLNRKEVEFCLHIGVNYLLSKGAMPFIDDPEADTPLIVQPDSGAVQ